MKNLLRSIGFAFLISLLLPQFSSAAPGSDNPLGPAGEYNGSITTGGSYDPYTGNANRVVDDLVVTGSLGAYPLKWSRFLNTRNPGPWTHNYQWGLWVKPWAYYHQYPELYEGPGGQVTYPDGRILTLELAEQPNTYGNAADTSEVQDRIAYTGNGNFDLLLRDGGKVKFEHVGNITGGNAYELIATQIIDPYGLVTVLTATPRAVSPGLRNRVGATSRSITPTDTGPVFRRFPQRISSSKRRVIPGKAITSDG